VSLLSISGHHAPALFSALLDLFKNSKLQKAILIFLHIAVTNAPSFFLCISKNNPLANTVEQIYIASVVDAENLTDIVNDRIDRI